MKIQKFDKYTEEEKKAILNHLWTYYAGSEYTSSDLDSYNELIDKDPDKLFEFAVFMFMSEINFQSVVLNSMKDNCISLFLGRLPNINDSSNLALQYNNAAINMLSEVIYTYNNQESLDLDVTFSNDKIKKLVLDRKK